MLYIAHDPKNFVGAEGVNDHVLMTDMLLNELAKAIALNKPELIASLREAGYAASDKASNKEISQNLVQYLPNSPVLQRSVAGIIYQNNSMYVKASGSSARGVKVTLEQMPEGACRTKESCDIFGVPATKKKDSFAYAGKWWEDVIESSTGKPTIQGDKSSIGTGKTTFGSKVGDIVQNEQFQTTVGGLLGGLLSKIKNKKSQKAVASQISTTSDKYASLFKEEPVKKSNVGWWVAGSLLGAALITTTIVLIVKARKK